VDGQNPKAEIRMGGDKEAGEDENENEGKKRRNAKAVARQGEQDLQDGALEGRESEGGADGGSASPTRVGS
jgi:hypothetical protein